MSLFFYRHNQSELSTDGIDLSSSCSFNLRDRSAWKLAISGGKGNSSGDDGGVGSGDDISHNPKGPLQKKSDTSGRIYQHKIKPVIV